MRKLIFTHAKNFERRFGVEALSTLRKRLIALAEFDEKRGLETRILFVDDAESARAMGIGNTDIPTAQLIKAVVDEANSKNPFDYFLIVGGDGIVPMFRYPSPVADDDDKVPSDNGYAITSTTARFGPYLVERAIGRLPTAADSGADVLWKQIDEILAFKSAKASEISSVGLCAEFWETPSRAIAQELAIAAANLHLSPPIDQDTPNSVSKPEWFSDRRLQFFNLHGLPAAGQWLGQKDAKTYPTAYSPQSISSDTRHAVIASEACYGGDILGTTRSPRMVSGSLCLTFLSRYAAGFCGSSTIAYGGTNKSPKLIGADLLTLYFLKAILTGKNQGDALLYAKSKLASDEINDKHALEPVTQKTLLQFCLFGDPSITPISDGPAASKLSHTASLEIIELAKSRKLSGQLQMLQAEVEPWDSSSKSQPKTEEIALTEYSEFDPVRLMRRSEILRWQPSSQAKNFEGTGRGTGTAAAMQPQEFRQLRHTDVFSLKPIAGGISQFLVLTMTAALESGNERPPAFEIAVSR
jgi:Peptidase family C25